MAVSRRVAGVVAAIATSIGLVLATAVPAHAGTAVGRSCGEAHPMDAGYYDAFGNAAPCTADFTTAGSGTVWIVVDVVAMPGNTRDDPHDWALDLDRCVGTVSPSEGPRTFACRYGPGAHTVTADKSVGDKFVDLRLYY